MREKVREVNQIKTGDIVTHEFDARFFNVISEGNESVVVISEGFTKEKIRAEVKNLTLICLNENRLDRSESNE